MDGVLERSHLLLGEDVPQMLHGAGRAGAPIADEGCGLAVDLGVEVIERILLL
jgi:hypothetical protein